MSKTFTAFVEFDPETKMYTGVVPGIPGAHSQGESIDELNLNLKEVIELCLEEMNNEVSNPPRFVGTQIIEVM